MHDKQIYIAGYRGMVCSAIVGRLVQGCYRNLVTRKRQELNLLDQKAEQDFLIDEKSDCIFCSSNSRRHFGNRYISCRFHLRKPPGSEQYNSWRPDG